jgi:methyltransferase (TIGR00027 family)
MSMSLGSTALSVGMQRAIHNRIDPQPHILHDHVAWQLLSAEERRLFDRMPAFFNTPMVKALRQRILLRQFYTEESLRKAVLSGATQYVILGAGMDSFGLRQPEWSKELAIFELDRPAEQRRKLERIERAGIRSPTNVSYLDADFESDNITEGLREAGFSFERQTFFSCLGVLVYLSNAAIDRLLAAVCGCCCSSEIVLTVATTNAQDSNDIFAKLAAAAGERWINAMAPEVIDERLRCAGWGKIEFIDNAELAAQFAPATDVELAKRDGARIVRASSRSQLVARRLQGP